jgi:hypothetical protein
MPAATTKKELQAVAKKEFDKLNKLLSGIDAETAMSKDDDDTSIKDTVAHRAHWIGLFLGWYTDGVAGKAVLFPAEGYKWNDLKRYNADLRATQSDLDWKTARSMLETANQQLLSFIEAHTDADLYDGPMAGANNTWTPGRWAEAAGPSHYRSAAKCIRARLRA